VEAAVVEPVDPLGGGDLDVVDGLIWPSALDQFGLVEAVPVLVLCRRRLTQFHNYTVDWQPTSVTWCFDAAKIRTVNGRSASS
jgi:hypothetical protein